MPEQQQLSEQQEELVDQSPPLEDLSAIDPDKTMAEVEPEPVYSVIDDCKWFSCQNLAISL